MCEIFCSNFEHVNKGQLCRRDDTFSSGNGINSNNVYPQLKKKNLLTKSLTLFGRGSDLAVRKEVEGFIQGSPRGRT